MVIISGGIVEAGSYANKIKYLYPTALRKDFQLEDYSDGDGPFISFWNTGKLGAQPSLAALDLAVSDSVANDTVIDNEKQALFDRAVTKAIGLTMRDYLNELRAIAGLPDLTPKEVKNKFTSYLPQ